jgi:hypothetical protein
MPAVCAEMKSFRLSQWDGRQFLLSIKVCWLVSLVEPVVTLTLPSIAPAGICNCGKEVKLRPCCTDTARVLHGDCTGVHGLFFN